MLDSYGVVRQTGGAFSDLGGNNIAGNTESNFLTDGDLPIPDSPMPLPCVDDADCPSGVCVGGTCAE